MRQPRVLRILGCVDAELNRLGLAIIEARRHALRSLEALAAPQATLRTRATACIRSAARRTIDASRRASTSAMAQLSDTEVAELRAWTDEQIELAGATVEEGITTCDFWIEQSSGMSPADVTRYSAALVPRPKDSPTGVPAALVYLFEDALKPLRHGLAVVRFADAQVGAERVTEKALLRAWWVYRDAAIECLVRWADVDERYHATTARFQELRWESAGRVDLASIREADAREAVEAALDALDAATPADPARAGAPDRPTDTEDAPLRAAGVSIEDASPALSR